MAPATTWRRVAVAFCGYVAALATYAFVPAKLNGWMWQAKVLPVFTVLALSRMTGSLVDNTGGSAVKVAANVLSGVAVLGGLASTIGHCSL